MATAAKYPTPKNEAEAARLLSELELLKLQLDAEQVALNQAVNELVTSANLRTEAVSDEFAQKFAALKTFATKNKSKLTDDGKRRSISWATGTLGWRSTPAGISVPRSTQDMDRLIARIITLKKTEFLRHKWDLNVEAMEANPEAATAIEGIKRRSASESFYVKFPDDTVIKQKIKLRTPADKDLKGFK